jgi:phosphoadenosine phosphosulfate reductase
LGFAYRSSRSLEQEMSEGRYGVARLATTPLDARELEDLPAHSVLERLIATDLRFAVTTSFQSSGLAMIHMLRDIKPDVPVLFLETGFHFPETLEFKDRIRDLWDLNLVELRGRHGSVEGQARDYGDALYERNPDLCCTINKVEPLHDALESYDGWLSALRRDQSVTRSEIPVAALHTLPSGKELLKAHPVASWTKNDVDAYLEKHDIPTHPLLEAGFTSIGCWPCTRAVDDDSNERGGRWPGMDKTECGIHDIGKVPAASEGRSARS